MDFSGVKTLPKQVLKRQGEEGLSSHRMFGGWGWGQDMTLITKDKLFLFPRNQLGLPDLTLGLLPLLSIYAIQQDQGKMERAGLGKGKVGDVRDSWTLTVFVCLVVLVVCRELTVP